MRYIILTILSMGSSMACAAVINCMDMGGGVKSCTNSETGKVDTVYDMDYSVRKAREDRERRYEDRHSDSYYNDY